MVFVEPDSTLYREYYLLNPSNMRDRWWKKLGEGPSGESADFVS